MRSRWIGVAFAVTVGTLLGAALGHTLSWQTATPLPTDADARAIAAAFVGHRPWSA